MEVEGRFVDARQNGATARLVIDSEPEPFIAPADGTVDNAVEQAGVARFLGQTVLRSKLSGKTFRRNLAPCKAVTRPAQFSGLGVLAILTVDLDRGMYSLDRDGVMAGAQVVYGSDNSLYVASRRYVRAIELGTDVPEGTRTEIHRFDISNPERTVYRSSGHGARLHPQQLRALRVRRRRCAWPPPRSRSGSRTARAWRARAR